jgi:hypothetical protein
MREPVDSEFDAVEQRLTARVGLAPTAGHRDRVLAAVRDTLDQRPGLPPRVGADLDGGSVAALVAIAFSALLAVVAPWLVVARTAAPLPMQPRIVAQARAAGIDLPIELVAAPILHAPRPASDPREPPPVRLHEAWRLRNLLTGEL